MLKNIALLVHVLEFCISLYTDSSLNRMLQLTLLTLRLNTLYILNDAGVTFKIQKNVLMALMVLLSDRNHLYSNALSNTIQYTIILHLMISFIMDRQTPEKLQQFLSVMNLFVPVTYWSLISFRLFGVYFNKIQFWQALSHPKRFIREEGWGSFSLVLKHVYQHTLLNGLFLVTHRSTRTISTKFALGSANIAVAYYSFFIMLAVVLNWDIQKKMWGVFRDRVYHSLQEMIPFSELIYSNFSLKSVDPAFLKALAYGAFNQYGDNKMLVDNIIHGRGRAFPGKVKRRNLAELARTINPKHLSRKDRKFFCRYIPLNAHEYYAVQYPEYTPKDPKLRQIVTTLNQYKVTHDPQTCKKMFYDLFKYAPQTILIPYDVFFPDRSKRGLKAFAIMCTGVPSLYAIMYGFSKLHNFTI